MFSTFKKYFFSNGYRRYKDSGKLVHRAIMEKRLRRQLEEDEVVHHQDGNKRNNRLSNLQVCSRSQLIGFIKESKNLILEREEDTIVMTDDRILHGKNFFYRLWL